MTDFLTRLAQRALGVAPVVQPLVRSAFVPMPTVNDRATSTPAPDLAEAERSTAPVASESARSNGHERGRVAARPPILERRAPIADPVAETESIITPPTVESPSRMRETRPVRSPDPADDTPSGMASVDPGTDRAQPATPRADDDGTESPASRLTVPMRAAAQTSRQALAREPTSERRANDDEAAPTIRVTIGRIDVRAITPPAPPPAPARPGPTLSLRDYLRQQSKKTPS
jgi:hypothetical protein